MDNNSFKKMRKEFRNLKPKKSTVYIIKKLLSVFVVLIMVSVVFSGVVDKYFSEVGSPTANQPNPYDWIIEDGDVVVRSDEELILNGDLIIKPGGNLTLNNVNLKFNSTLSNSLKLEVQANNTGNYSKMGELNILNSNITITDPDGDHYFEFIIKGNATIYNTKLSYIGGSDPVSGIQIYSDNVIISKCTIEHCKYSGLYISADPIIFENTISGNKYGIYYESAHVNLTSCLGQSTSDKFGMTVSAVSDLNNDSFDDIVIGVPYADCNGNNNGSVYIFYNNENIEIDDLNLEDADLIIQGETSGGLFGSSIDTAGDLNGDSIP